MNALSIKPKTQIVIVEGKSGKKQVFETGTEVNISTVRAFNALLSLPKPERFLYNQELRILTITLSEVEDWEEIRTEVPRILAESRISVKIKYTWIEKLTRIFAAIASGIAIVWSFIAPRVQSFALWVAPQIKAVLVWSAPRIMKAFAFILAKLKSAIKR